MNELQIFENAEFGSVRTVMIDDTPYFVGKDVATALGYGNSREALHKHVDDEDKNTVTIRDGNTRGNPNVTVINESGLYSLVLSSKLPNAKKFKRWVTNEVLPSIRKHGAYMTPKTIMAAFEKPETIIGVLTALKNEQEKNIELELKNQQLTTSVEIMQPKAEYFDALVDSNLLTNFRETAKEFGISQQSFVDLLMDKKFIYKDKRGNLTPYAKKKNKELFKIKEYFNRITNHAGVQTLITPKGRETFRRLCEGMCS